MSYLSDVTLAEYQEALSGEMGRIASQFQMTHHVSRHHNVWIERQGKPRFHEPRISNVVPQQVVPTGTASTLPGAPTRIEFGYNPSMGILMWNWSAPTGTTIVGYRIEVSTSGPDLNFANPIIAGTLGPATTYNHPISSPDTYYIRLWAINASGEGPYAGLAAPVTF